MQILVSSEKDNIIEFNQYMMSDCTAYKLFT